MRRADPSQQDALGHCRGTGGAGTRARLSDGGILAEAPAAIAEAYRTGRGSFRVRARWTTEALGHGQYQIVITEIPYQVPKARVIERIAELLAARKLPMLADIRDESTEAVRVVLEPKSRTVEAEHLMEHLFRLTDLEIRFGLNMNVLGADNTPRVMNLKEVLAAFLDHRHQVLVRRTQFPPGQNRPPARNPGRVADRLPQPRRGHPHHPRGGRTEGRAHPGVQL